MTTNDKTREALEACPFCGGGGAHNTYVSNFQISSPRTGRKAVCGQCSASTGAFATEVEALASWNRRAAITPAQPPVAAVPAQPFNREEAKAALAFHGLNQLRELSLVLRAQLHLMERLAATPTPAPAAQGEADAAAAKEADAVEVLTEEGWVWDGDQWQRPPERAEVRPPVLTADAVESLAHRKAWKYKHSSDPHHSDTYTFNRTCLLDFVTALGVGIAPPAADSAQALERKP